MSQYATFFVPHWSMYSTRTSVLNLSVYTKMSIDWHTKLVKLLGQNVFRMFSNDVPHPSMGSLVLYLSFYRKEAKTSKKCQFVVKCYGFTAWKAKTMSMFATTSHATKEILGFKARSDNFFWSETHQMSHLA